MSDNKNLFEEFEANTFEEWLEKLQKDLKGRPHQELNWQMEKGIKLPPYFTAEQIEKYTPLSQEENTWQIGSCIDTSQGYQKANHILLKELEGGVQAPIIILKAIPSEEEMGQLFQNVDLSIISTHFDWPEACKHPLAFLELFYDYLTKSTKYTSELKGSFGFSPSVETLRDARLFLEEKHQLRTFQLFKIDGCTYYDGVENSSEELAKIIFEINLLLAASEKQKIEVEGVAKNLVVSIAIDHSFFVSIAKIRSLKLLWENLLEAYDITNPPSLTIEAHFAEKSLKPEKEDNMIRAASQAMSAIIGGIDRLYFLPSDSLQNKQGSFFTRRIARNLQHILQMESFLDKVVDPAAGSYYIEYLTNELGNAAWEKFKHKVK